MANVEERLQPNQDQETFLIYMGVCVVVIGILWHLPFVKHILDPFKLIVVALHEVSHAIAGLATCAHIVSIEVTADQGGVTKMRGGIAWITLPAGYIGSAFFGALMVFSTFNTTALYVVSGFIILCLVFVLIKASNWLSRGLTVLFITIIILIWVFAAYYLRYFIGFLGVMSGSYSLWDMIDDLVANDKHQSDATVFAQRYGGSSKCWGFIWFILGLALMIGSAVLGLYAF
eukprot:NODE_1081_length_2307_cov_0.795743.p2 type:complete len:231 gc:universal NODE_1081_length_2307_cov_0.795743:488-1180(+)